MDGTVPTSDTSPTGTGALTNNGNKRPSSRARSSISDISDIVNPYKRGVPVTPHRDNTTRPALSTGHISSTQPHEVSHSTVTTFHHHIKQTFLGPVCSACNKKIASTNILFDISRNSLRAHLTTNQCYTGNLSFFKSRELEMSLRTSIVEHYKSPQPSKHLENTFQQVSSLNNMPYCSRCGFVGGKLFNVTRHVKSTTNSCTDTDVRPAGGIIKVDKYGFLVPKELLDKISLGSFTLPFNHIDNLNSQSNQSTAINNYPNTNSVYASPPTNDAIKTRFLPTDEDIAATFSTNPPCKDSTSLSSFAQAELLDCFLTEEHANTAHEYLTSFIHLIEQGSPGLLELTLLDYVPK